MLNEYNLRRLILQLALVMSLFVCHGQTPKAYTGLIVNSGNPLDNVQLILKENSTLLAVSDSLGKFSFKLNSDVKPVVQFVAQGFYTLEISLQEGYNLVNMLENINMLNQIVVSESKTEKQFKRTTISMDLISVNLIEQTAPVRIQESINRINGVQIVDNQANIRSGSGWSYGAGSRVQVLVNDIPMLSGDAAQAQWSFIPTEGIEKIEIIKGASSVVYGSSALNGVINIKTKTNSIQPFTSVSLTSGIYDLPKRKSLRYRGNTRNSISNVSAFNVGKIEQLDYTLSLNMLYDDGYKMNDGDYRGRTTFSLRKANAEKNTVAGASAAIQLGKSSSFLLWENYNLGYTSLDSSDTKTQSLRLSFDPYYNWGKGSNRHKLVGRYLKVSNDVDNGDTSVDQSNFSDLGYVEYQFLKSFKPIKLKMVSGLVGQYSVTRSPLFNGVQKTSNAAAFVQLEKEWGNLLINGGMRFENYSLNSRSESKPVFRAGANYELGKASFLRASIGQGFRFPSVAETYITTSVGPVTIYPNPELNSESGYSWELGFKQGLELKKLRILLDMAYFEMHFDQMTEFLFAQWEEFKNFDDIGAGFKAINAGKTSIRGFEVSTALRFPFTGGNLEGFIGYNFTDARSTEPDLVIAQNFYGDNLTYSSTSSSKLDNRLKYRPKNSLKADFILTYNRFSIGYGVSWQDATENIDTAFVSPPITWVVSGVDTAMSEGLTAYSIHNIRLGFKVNQRLKINLIVSNITNSEFMIRPADLGEPRSFRFQINYTFRD